MKDIKRILNTTKYVITTAFLIVCFSFASYAYDNDFLRDNKELFMIDESDIEDIKFDIDQRYGDAERIMQESVFASSTSESIVSVKYSTSSVSISDIFDCRLNTNTQEGYLEILRYDFGEESTVDITIDYIAENEEIGFATVDGIIVRFSEIEKVQMLQHTDGSTTVKIQLTFDELENIDCLGADNGVYLIRFASTGGTLCINSILVEMNRGVYSGFVLIDDAGDTVEPVAVVKNIISSDCKMRYKNSMNCISIITSDNCIVEEKYCIDNYDISVKKDSILNDFPEYINEENADESIDVEEYTEKLSEYSGETIDEEAGLAEELDEPNDLLDRDYLSLDDGASTIYSDEYIFTDDVENYVISLGTDSTATDYLGQVYEGKAKIGKDNLNLDNVFELLGCNIEDILLPYNAMQFTIANVIDADYAGELSIDADIEEAGLVLSKGDGEYFEPESMDMQLTELFLKKASYCGIDADGIICASYDSDGYLSELAEGYTEDDIAYFVLIPASTGEETKISVNNITVRYNGILSEESYYFDIKVINEAGETVEPVSDFSGYFDGETPIESEATDSDAEEIEIEEIEAEAGESKTEESGSSDTEKTSQETADVVEIEEIIVDSEDTSEEDKSENDEEESETKDKEDSDATENIDTVETSEEII